MIKSVSNSPHIVSLLISLSFHMFSPTKSTQKKTGENLLKIREMVNFRPFSTIFELLFENMREKRHSSRSETPPSDWWPAIWPDFDHFSSPKAASRAAREGTHQFRPFIHTHKKKKKSLNFSGHLIPHFLFKLFNAVSGQLSMLKVWFPVWFSAWNSCQLYRWEEVLLLFLLISLNAH